MKTPTKTLRVKNPTDLLALVPYAFGFHPQDSLVMVTGEAAEPFHVRVDLPAPEDLDALCGHLATLTRRHRVRTVAVALYTDDAALAEAVYAALEPRLVEAGARVGEAVRADGSRWWTLTGCTGPCCPAEGTPYDLSGHEFTAQGVLDGRVTLGSRAELAESLVGTDPAEVEAVGAGADAALLRLQKVARSPFGPVQRPAGRAHLVQEGRWVEQRLRRYLADGERLDAEEVGRLLVVLVSIEVRDVAWSLMDRANAARHVLLWRDIVRRSPPGLVAPPAALLAFAAWLDGDGALAWCAVERCQEDEPGYGLAGLLTEALAGAVPPSTWQPMRRELLTLFAG
ncbi:MAG: DUF4192 domain-containing protein [Nocardioidaceae bacterium]